MAKWMPFRFAAGAREIARLLGAAGQQNGVERLAQLFTSAWPTCALVLNSTPSAFICSMRRSMQMLLHLEIGDAVAQQSADAVGFFEHRDRVAGARQAAAPRPGPRDPIRPPPRVCRCFT
jgi:hypothetical protein